VDCGRLPLARRMAKPPGVNSMYKTFPICQLHSTPIVLAFPDECPFAEFHPFEAIIRIRDAGWRQLGADNSGQYAMGLANLERERVCHRCISRLSSHQWVQNLRRGLEKDSEPPSARKEPAGRTPEPVIRGRVVA